MGAAVRNRVLVAHPDPEACERLCLALRLSDHEPQFALDVQSMFLEMAYQAPDLLILSKRVDPDGITGLLATVRTTRPFIPVLVLTADREVDTPLVEDGGGYVTLLSEPVVNGALISAVRRILMVPPGFQPVMLPDETRLRPIGLPSLTPRERQVLDRIVAGNSNKRIARDLDISPRTVEVHRARIMEKMGARNVVDLIRKLLSGGS